MRIIQILFILLIGGCLGRPVVHKQDNKQHALQSKAIERSVLKTAKTGDWLVTRGYHLTDNLVSNATGVPISHVGVFDLKTLQVIEAEGKGVHTTLLKDFIDKSYRLLIIRPRWRTEANAEIAFNKAKELIGKSYDFLGVFGFNYPSKYYCSELAVYIYKPWHKKNERFPGVIKPGELYLFGEVLYDSLPRDEM